MIDRATVIRLSLVSALLLVLAAGVSFAVWRSLPLVGGLATGFVLGLIPFLSWTWIAGRGLSSGARRALSVLLLAGKLGLYAAVLYLSVTREIVNPVGVLVGITLVVFVFTAGSLASSRAPNGAHP